MMELASYVCGAWASGKEARVSAATLVNPATEEALATASTEGVDFGGPWRSRAIAAARRSARMTFKQRGELLRAMSQRHPRQARRAARARDRRTAATPGPTRSSTSTAPSARSRPTPTWRPSSATRRSSSTATASSSGEARACSVSTPTSRALGVAVHVNAFNFPAWGLGEKAACALLAGMPVIAKPATSTALVAYRMVQILVEAKVLPEGVLSLVCGSSGDLLDRLGGQDVLAFTGSSLTAAMLRGGKAITHASAHVNVEADSLNSAVLGPDVGRGVRRR